MQVFENFMAQLSNFVWGLPMIILLLGTHIFMTIRLKFPQRRIWQAIKLSITKDGGSGDVSPFGSLAVALAATIGTGNIVGIATAISLGGPGAVFWCWLTGILGMSTKYAEGFLAVKYRVKTADGSMLGGPMYALERGLNMKWLAIAFCVFTSIAAFGIGNMVQANSFTNFTTQTLGINPYIVASVLAVTVGLVILGGVKSIAKACQALVPFMAFFYVFGCIIIMVINRAYLGETFSLIFESAFNSKAIGGGVFGGSIMMAARFGIARGLFSNESGMGSAPIIAAAAQTRNPARQALVSATGTFWDTVVICAITGIVMVSSVLAHPEINFSASGGELARLCFSKIPYIGTPIITVGLLTFSFSTLLGWSYYGEKALEYLGGKKSIPFYRILWVIGVFVGSILSLELVWNIADCMNAFMAIPNLISIILLSGVIAKGTQKYVWENKIDEYGD